MSPLSAGPFSVTVPVALWAAGSTLRTTSSAPGIGRRSLGRPDGSGWPGAFGRSRTLARVTFPSGSISPITTSTSDAPGSDFATRVVRLPSRPSSIFVSSEGGMASPIRVPVILATAMPTSRPCPSTTGPPLLPGLMSPSIWTTATSPASSSRRLDTVPLPTVTAGFPRVVDRAVPNGNPRA